MKVGSKRRRTKEQIAQDRHEELQKIQLVEGKMERWQQMEAELQQAKNTALQNDGANDCIQKLIEQGVLMVDENNTITPVVRNSLA